VPTTILGSGKVSETRIIHSGEVCAGQNPFPNSDANCFDSVDTISSPYSCPLLLQDVATDSFTDLPIQQHQGCIHPASHRLACGDDQIPNVGEKGSGFSIRVQIQGAGFRERA
jgi:hypothetical protein